MEEVKSLEDQLSRLLEDEHLSPETKGKELLEIGVKLIDDYRLSSEISKLHCAVDCLGRSLAMMPNAGTRVRNNLAIALNIRYEKLGALEDLERSIKLHEDALSFFDYEDEQGGVENAGQGYVDKGSTLNRLADRLSARFDIFGQDKDLSAAVKRDEEALLLYPPGHKFRARSLDNLANRFSKKFRIFGVEEDLNTAISLHQEALALEPPGDDGRIVTLNQLGNALRERFEKYGNSEDLDTAIEMHREALSLLPPTHKHRIAALNSLAGTLMRRFEKFGLEMDSNTSIALFEEGLESLPISHPHRMLLLANLAGALSLRFDKFGRKEALDRSIALYEEALTLQPAPQPSNRVALVRDLANRLSNRFKNFGDIDDINTAIRLDEEALALSSSGHNDKASLSKLADKLSARFKATGMEEDQENAIKLYKEALSLQLPGSPGREAVLHNLACELAIRFETSGEEKNLDSSIAMLEEVLSWRPVGHESRGLSLNILGRVLLLRYNMHGYDEDLNSAINTGTEALSLHPPGHPCRTSSLNNLANALQTRYEIFRKGEDLDAAIQMNEEALALQPPGHQDRKGTLNNLAGVLTERFTKFNDKQDLDAAISLHEEVLKLSRPGHQHSIFNFALLLSNKFDKFGNLDDINRAISLFQEALQTVFKDSAMKAYCMLQLGIALIRRFKVLESKEGIDDIMKLFEELSSMTMQFAVAFKGAQIWAIFANQHSHPSTAKAFRTAIDLLPFLVPITFSVDVRAKTLANIEPGFASHAAAHSLHTMKSCNDAIELLEAGRFIFWSQALRTSPDMLNLAGALPDLYRQLQMYSKELEKTSQGSLTVEDSIYTPSEFQDARKVSHLKILQDNWFQTLEDVRGHSGFENFLKPMNISRLKAARSHGIIVVLNTTTTSCDALIMTPQTEDIIHLPIPEVDSDVAARMAELLRHLIRPGSRNSTLNININLEPFKKHFEITFLGSPEGISRYGKRWGTNAQTDIHWRPFIFAAVLDWLWQKIALPIIQLLKLKKSSKPPRLWWCPAGPLTFLPLHAAGSYKGEEVNPEDLVPEDLARNIETVSVNESLSDYVISSYTSTVTALVQQRLVDAEQIPEFKFVSIADTSNLSKTAEEARKIRQYIPSEHMIELGTVGSPPASIDEVCNHMEVASVVHFACHGRQVAENPLESGLLVTNGKYLRISDIMKLSIPNASLAFLSACETAMGDEKLPDEALHVGASLIFAGFKGVVATMWEMQDDDGPIIADIFYKHLFKDVDFAPNPVTGFDPTKAAEALHYAVKEMQARGIPPERWAPFIHIGM